MVGCQKKNLPCVSTQFLTSQVFLLFPAGAFPLEDALPEVPTAASWEIWSKRALRFWLIFTSDVSKGTRRFLGTSAFGGGSSVPRPLPRPAPFFGSAFALLAFALAVFPLGAEGPELLLLLELDLLLSCGPLISLSKSASFSSFPALSGFTSMTSLGIWTTSSSPLPPTALSSDSATFKASSTAFLDGSLEASWARAQVGTKQFPSLLGVNLL